VDSAQDEIMLRTVPYCGSMGSMTFRGGLVRANLYLVIPIFLAMRTCLTKSGLTAYGCGKEWVMLVRLFLSGTCNHLTVLCVIKVDVVRLIFLHGVKVM
jgi:hypothetical protein